MYSRYRCYLEVSNGSAGGSLIIFDDLEVVETSEFSTLVKKTESRGSYFLLICRELVGVGSLGGLSIAVSSILYLCCSSDGFSHYTKRYIDLNTHPTELGRVDIALVEDSKMGRSFLRTC